MQQLIRQGIRAHSKELYIILIFPIAFSCLLTFAGARIMSLVAPQVGLWVSKDFRIHHFAYGFWILTASGYLALIFSGPRAKFLISLLFGLGLGLAFDEFAMWLELRGDDTARQSYDGIVIICIIFLLLISIEPGVRFLEHHWPFSSKKLAAEHKARKALDLEE